MSSLRSTPVRLRAVNRTVLPNTSVVRYAICLPCGAVCAASDDGRLRIFADNGHALAKVDAHRGRVRGLCIVDDDTLISVGEDAYLCAWHLYDGQLRFAHNIRLHLRPFSMCAVGGTRMLIGAESGHAVVCDWNASLQRLTADRSAITMHRDLIGTIAAHGPLIATGSKDRTVGLWRRADLSPILRLLLPHSVFSVAISNTHIAAGGTSCVTLHRNAAPHFAPCAKVHVGYITWSLRFVEDHTLLSGGDSFIDFIDPEQAAIVNQLETTAKHVHDMDITPRGDMLVSGNGFNSTAILQLPDEMRRLLYQSPHKHPSNPPRMPPPSRIPPRMETPRTLSERDPRAQLGRNTSNVEDSRTDVPNSPLRTVAEEKPPVDKLPSEMVVENPRAQPRSASLHTPGSSREDVDDLREVSHRIPRKVEAQIIVKQQENPPKNVESGHRASTLSCSALKRVRSPEDDTNRANFDAAGTRRSASPNLNRDLEAKRVRRHPNSVAETVKDDHPSVQSPAHSKSDSSNQPLSITLTAPAISLFTRSSSHSGESSGSESEPASSIFSLDYVIESATQASYTSPARKRVETESLSVEQTDTADNSSSDSSVRALIKWREKGVSKEAFINLDVEETAEALAAFMLGYHIAFKHKLPALKACLFKLFESQLMTSEDLVGENAIQADHLVKCITDAVIADEAIGPAQGPLNKIRRFFATVARPSSPSS